jgi:hypothetical protein
MNHFRKQQTEKFALNGLWICGVIMLVLIFIQIL